MKRVTDKQLEAVVERINKMKGGGITQVIGLGTKRELLNQMWSFIAGIEAKNA